MSLPERLDPNIWGQQDTQSRAARAETATIAQREASAASAAASAESTRATLPSDVRLGEAQATGAELRNEQLRRALQAGAGASTRRFGDELAAAEQEMLTIVQNVLQARRLSRDMFGATGFGHSAMANYFPGGSPAQDVAGLLPNIASYTALNKLMELKTDPRNETGGALGQVTERELAMLMSALGALDPNMSDEEFQRQADRVLEGVLMAYNKLGGDPYAVAGLMAPDEVERYAPMLRGWRALPEDEQALIRYANEQREAGTFDPAVYAQLTAEAYARATGRQPDEQFILNAMTAGEELAAQPGAISGLSYDEADQAVREQAVRIVQGQGADQIGLSEALGGAAINFIPSTFELAYDTVRALTVDAPDTIEGIVDIVAGATGLSEDDTAWEAVKDYYEGRYGSSQGFLQALRTDPAGIMADIAGIATGGGLIAAKTAGTAGRVSRIAALSNAARAAEGFTAAAAKLDPLMTAAELGSRGIRMGASAIGNVATEVPARMAGVPGGAVEQAVSAGRRGSTAFTEQMTGAPNAPNPVDQLDTAVSELYDRRSLEYQNARNNLNLNETVPFTEIDRALLDTQSVGRYRDIDYRRAPQAWQDASDIIERFRSAGYNDVGAVDAMKQQLGALRDTFPLGSPERSVVQDIYNGVRTAITQSAPEYAKMMEDYSAASDALSDIRATLSAGAASPDTTLRRLQQQVAGTGPRGRTVLDIIESTQSGAGIGDAVAGLALSGTRPSGMTSALAPMAALTGSPEAIAALTVTPQSVGRRAYQIGQGFGSAERIANTMSAPLSGLVQKYAGAVDPALLGLRMANPTLIQPQVDPFTPPAEPAYTEEERLLLEQEPRNILPFTAQLGVAPGDVSLADLSRQYQISTPSEAVSLEALAGRYTEPAPTAAAPAGDVREINGRTAIFDPTANAWLDLETGEPLAEQGFRKGGRVAAIPAPPLRMYAHGGRVQPRKRRAMTHTLKG